jgi:hypothetical protein
MGSSTKCRLKRRKPLIKRELALEFGAFCYLKTFASTHRRRETPKTKRQQQLIAKSLRITEVCECSVICCRKQIVAFGK